MDQAFWLARERDSIGHARAATLADVRLMHYELATAYSLKAVEARLAYLKAGRPARAGASL